MLRFFSKKEKVTDLTWLGVDMHSHLVPGIDDGTANTEEALIYLEQLRDLGLSKFICTPHVFTELYPNTPETISTAFSHLQQAAIKQHFNAPLAAAAEYMIDDTFRVTDNLLCLHERYLLVEMSYLSEFPNIDQIIFDLHIAGYKPVLAHPERYVFYYRDRSRLSRLKEIGCLFQLNLLSVLGYYGPEAKNQAKYLLENKLYDLAGTDLHHERHLRVLSEGVRSGKLHELIGHYAFRNQELFG
ncbi:histidinol phosphatase [Pedobacter yulinensis]|uniref:protein-tyrosine-phosphatase n=1 Tax=Pedobacter yulinensis TaxID=2126353 RepID=A0A2T3HQP6_9SPHI|nr:CpsB/CapC family capsule biosynthesis tyrosine phosphatase [Pedobacter yulinensis]PST84768.1 histidinol phosphatase [Pedobacter yulinensis]